MTNLNKLLMGAAVLGATEANPLTWGAAIAVGTVLLGAGAPVTFPAAAILGTGAAVLNYGYNTLFPGVEVPAVEINTQLSTEVVQAPEVVQTPEVAQAPEAAQAPKAPKAPKAPEAVKVVPSLNLPDMKPHERAESNRMADYQAAQAKAAHDFSIKETVSLPRSNSISTRIDALQELNKTTNSSLEVKPTPAQEASIMDNLEWVAVKSACNLVATVTPSATPVCDAMPSSGMVEGGALAALLLEGLRRKLMNKKKEATPAPAAKVVELTTSLDDDSSIREEAATKIQSVFRGYKARKEAAALVAAALVPAAPAIVETMNEQAIRVARTFVKDQTLVKAEAARQASKNKAPQEQIREGAVPGPAVLFTASTTTTTTSTRVRAAAPAVSHVVAAQYKSGLR
jgi:hypothetical protein